MGLYRDVYGLGFAGMRDHETTPALGPAYPSPKLWNPILQGLGFRGYGFLVKKTIFS